MIADAVIAGWLLLLVAFAGLGAHRVALALAALRPAAPVARRADTPVVTVQLPMFEELAVAERAIAAAGHLDWPRDRLEIQVLDDSRDATREVVDAAVARLVAAGVDAKVVRRPDRTGFKAGALAHGLVRARGEIVVILDADFVPPSDLLHHLVPPLVPGVACTQARWGHLNVGDGLLTRCQATLLDAHFVLEHRGRARSGCWFNFNGTAGAWRVDAIGAAGGWRADTLVEDLDLSYRAQLAGWRLVYLDDVVVPGELPRRLDAFLAQQHRWAKGGVQASRRLLPRVVRADVPWRVRAEAVAHLTGNVGYPLTLALAALGPAVPWLRADSFLSGVPRGVDLAIAGLGVGPLLVAYAAAIGLARSGHAGRRLLELPAVLALGAGLCVAQSSAVLGGLGRDPGTFERTPKEGDAPGERYAPARRPGGGTELVLAAWQVVGFAGAVAHGAAGPGLLTLVLGAGLGGVGLGRLAAGRARMEPRRPLG